MMMVLRLYGLSTNGLHMLHSEWSLTKKWRSNWLLIGQACQMLPETSLLLSGELEGYLYLLTQCQIWQLYHSLSHGDKTMMSQTNLNLVQRVAKEIQQMPLLHRGMALNHSLSQPLMKVTVVGIQIHWPPLPVVMSMSTFWSEQHATFHGELWAML